MINWIPTRTANIRGGKLILFKIVGVGIFFTNVKGESFIDVSFYFTLFRISFQIGTTII